MGEAGEGSGPRLTRRGFVRDAGMAAAAVGLAGPLAAPAIGAPRGRRVAVLGGGMAGLTVAHELVERGFKVDVYEPVALGGKARSIDVPGPRHGRARDRCPASTASASSRASTTTCRTRCAARPTARTRTASGTTWCDTSEGRRCAPTAARTPACSGCVPDPVAALTPEGLQALLLEEIVKQKMVPPHEAGYLATRLAVFLTSCEERRFGQWEHMAWWDFIGAASRSDEYQKVAARGLTRIAGGGQGDGGLDADDRQHGRGVRHEHHAARQRRRAGPGARRAHERGLDQALGAASAGARACASTWVRRPWPWTSRGRIATVRRGP